MPPILVYLILQVSEVASLEAELSRHDARATAAEAREARLSIECIEGARREGALKQQAQSLEEKLAQVQTESSVISIYTYSHLSHGHISFWLFVIAFDSNVFCIP